MATDAEIHKRNLESSILFMQQNHAATLKALHEEIQKLQKHCTDLTFQLTMSGININESGNADIQLEEVSRQLQESQKQEATVRRQLAERQEKVQKLEQEIRHQKKRHLDEVRNTNQTISELQAQVEAKSNNIAFLTTELHRLKVHQKSEQTLLQAGGTVAGDVGASIVRRIQPHHLPAPPKDIHTNSAHVRQRVSNPVGSSSVRHRVVKVSNSSGSGEGEVLARTVRGISASTRSSGSESPDISPFLQKDKDFTVEIKKPAVLPPIPASVSSQADHPDRSHVEMHHVVITQAGHHRVAKGRPRTPEVATLAVDQVGETKWNRAHESRSSEYNEI